MSETAHPHDWKAEGLETHLGIVAGGKLLGLQMQPREVAAGLYGVGFHDAKVLADGAKVCLSESQGYERAVNDNLAPIGSCKILQVVADPADPAEKYQVRNPSTGQVDVLATGEVRTFSASTMVVTSRDCGVMQVNIPAEWIGTEREEALYVPANCFSHAHVLWSNRGFEPWVAFTSNVFLRDTYLKRASRGVANFLAELDLERSPTDTLAGHAYLHGLTSPVLDYEYRVAGMNAALNEARRSVSRRPVELTEVEAAIVRGIAAAKS